MTEFLPLSFDCERSLAGLLRAIGTTRGVGPHDLTGFWPMVGHTYRAQLVVVGKAVKQWHDRVTVEQLAEPGEANRFARAMRRTAERGGCPMAWVTDAWGRRDGYNTEMSAFWRFARNALISLDPSAVADPVWSGRLAWSNVAKIAPWAGGNPGGKLLRIQCEMAPALLAEEIATYSPATVLVTTGRWWFEPFADELNLEVDWHSGGLEGYAEHEGRRWIIRPLHDLRRG